MNREIGDHPAAVSQRIVVDPKWPAEAAPNGGPSNVLPLRGALDLTARIGRRRFLRRTFDGIFAGVTAVAVGKMSLPDFVRKIPVLPNYPQYCEEQGNCSPPCCGPDAQCGTSCCGVHCCGGPGRSTCVECRYKGGNDWYGQSCWQNTSCNPSYCYVTICCDCEANCSGPKQLCICSSVSRYGRADGGWERWNPQTETWTPVADPMAA